jgi:hypothetical protein
MAKSLRASNANAVSAAPGRRIKRSELVRIEVRVSKADAELLRRIASALADPRRAARPVGFYVNRRGRRAISRHCLPRCLLEISI